MSTDLVNMPMERIKELVATVPTKKRAALGKALRAACQHLRDSKENYDKAFDIASVMVENWWRLGGELRRLKEQGMLDTGGRPGKTGPPGDQFVSLPELGINKNQSARCQAIAEKSKVELDEYIDGLYSAERYTLPTLKGFRRNLAPGQVETPELSGRYGVIVIDPPWPMEKIERNERPNQAGFDYPTMTEDQLGAMKLPHADNCHVWCWTTHKFMPMSFRLFVRWEVKYVCTFVWHKPGGFQPFGLPQYNCEFCLYGRLGSPQFKDVKDFKVCFEANRGSHSEKPDAFYDLVRRVTTGKRIDMFNRRKIKGFVGWGAEAK